MAPAPIQVQVHPSERRRRRGVVLNAACCCCCCCLHSVGGLIGALIGSKTSNRHMPPPPWTPPAPDVLAGFRPESSEQIRERTPEDAPAAEVEEHIAERPAGPVGPPLSEQIAETPTASSGSPLEQRRPWQSIDRQDPRARGGVKGLSGAGLYWLVLLLLTPVAAIGLAIYNHRPGGPLDEAIGIGGILILLLLPAVQLAASLVSVFIVLLWPVSERGERLYQIGRITLYMVLGTVVGIVLMVILCLPFSR